MDEGQAVESMLYADKDGHMVEVSGPLKDPVEFASQGGGFVHRLPLATFQEIFRPAALPQMHKIMVGGDWLPDGMRLEAYSDGRRWNGWAMPYFSFEAVQQLLEQMPDVTYDQARDAFVVTMEDSDEPEVYQAETLTVAGQPVKVYALGAGGWCWDHLGAIDEQAARPRERGG